MNKLPVIGTVSEVVSGVLRHYFQLIYVAWPAVLLLLLSFGAMVWIYLSSGILDAANGQNPEDIKAALERMESGGNNLVFIFGGLLAGLASAVSAVRWHRFVLLGEGAGGRFGQIRVLRREDGSYIWATIKLFFVYMLFIAAIAILAMLVVMLSRAMGAGGERSAGTGLLVVLGAFAVYVAALMVIFRLMIALPDAAVGQGGRVLEMFRRTRGNSWRLLGAFILLFLIGGVAMGLAGVVFGLLAGIGFVGVLVAGLLYAGVYLFFLMMQITMLSVSYREIIGLPADMRPPEVTA